MVKHKACGAVCVSTRSLGHTTKEQSRSLLTSSQLARGSNVAFLTNWKALAAWLFSNASLDFLACQFFALMLLLLIGMLSLNVARFERRCGMPYVIFLVAKLCQSFL
jgi:hypothetical protein